MDHRIGGKQIEFEAFWHGDGLELGDRVRSRDIFWHLMVRIIARGTPLLRHTQLITLDSWCARLGDDLFLARDQFIKVFHFPGQVTHLMTAEEENVSLIDGSKFVAVKRVLFHDQSAQTFGLLKIRPRHQGFILLPERSELLPIMP